MKNEYEIRGDVTAIFINSPKYGSMEALISTGKLEKAKSFENTWYVGRSIKLNTFYVIGSYKVSYGKRSVVPIHRWLNDSPNGMAIDHINHDTLDNTDNNLRIVTIAQNNQNRKGARITNSSGIRGVTWSKRDKKWQVRMKLNGKEYFFGYYKSIEEAEKVAIEKRKEQMPFYVA